MSEKFYSFYKELSQRKWIKFVRETLILKINNSNKYNIISSNTYVENSRSHKFYFNQGFKVLGFHFE